MAFGVFIHRVDSIYDDSPAERYQFPAQYLGRATPSIGDWILYYEPRKVANTRGYFAVAKVERIIADPSAPGMYLALIEPGSYLGFATPVPFCRAGRPCGTWCPERSGEDIRPTGEGLGPFALAKGKEWERHKRLLTADPGQQGTVEREQITLWLR